MNTQIQGQPRRPSEIHFASLSPAEQNAQAVLFVGIVALLATKLEAQRQQHCDRTATALLVDVAVTP